MFRTTHRAVWRRKHKVAPSRWRLAGLLLQDPEALMTQGGDRRGVLLNAVSACLRRFFTLLESKSNFLFTRTRQHRL